MTQNKRSFYQTSAGRRWLGVAGVMAILLSGLVYMRVDARNQITNEAWEICQAQVKSKSEAKMVFGEYDVERNGKTYNFIGDLELTDRTGTVYPSQYQCIINPNGPPRDFKIAVDFSEMAYANALADADSDNGSAIDAELQSYGVTRKLLEDLNSNAASNGYSINRNVPMTERELVNFTFAMISICEDIRIGATSWDQEMSQDISGGAPRNDAARMHQFLETEFCPRIKFGK